jgi:hypothetical protein
MIQTKFNTTYTGYVVSNIPLDSIKEYENIRIQ